MEPQTRAAPNAVSHPAGRAVQPECRRGRHNRLRPRNREEGQAWLTDELRRGAGWIPTRSATPSTALVPQRKVGFPIPNTGLLLGFQGTKTARREGISSPFSDGVALRPRTQAVPGSNSHEPPPRLLHVS